jgi:hypothetical protein
MWSMWPGKHMAKQVDSTTSIASTQNHGIHGIHFSQHTTFNKLSYLASKPVHGLSKIWCMDWTAWKSSNVNQQMLSPSVSLKLISVSGMIVGLQIIRLSSEYYTTGIFWNVFSSFGTFDISGPPQCWTGAPRRLGKLQNIHRDQHWPLVVGFARSAPCWSDNCAWHFGIRPDPVDQFLRQSACLVAVLHDC